MEVTTSKRIGPIMLMAALILWSSIGADAASSSCTAKCAVLCAGDDLPFICIPKCLKRCSSESLTSSALEHCNVGCFLSTCLHYHPGTKKVGVDVKMVGADVKMVGACMDSCSQGCQKTYPLH